MLRHSHKQILDNILLFNLSKSFLPNSRLFFVCFFFESEQVFHEDISRGSTKAGSHRKRKMEIRGRDLQTQKLTELAD
jgi:hypothetical protein